MIRHAPLWIAAMLLCACAAAGEPAALRIRYDFVQPGTTVKNRAGKDFEGVFASAPERLEGDAPAAMEKKVSVKIQPENRLAVRDPEKLGAFTSLTFSAWITDIQISNETIPSPRGRGRTAPCMLHLKYDHL